MVEILAWIAGHAEALHHPQGGPVCRYRVGDDLGKAEPAEAVFDRSSRRLNRITLSPIGTRQPPRRFDRRREGERPSHVIEPNDADERRRARQFDDPLAEPMALPMSDHTRYPLGIR